MLNTFFNKILHRPTQLGLDVYVQDQTTEIIDLYMVNIAGAITPVLSAGALIDAKTINVVSSTGVLATGVHAINISENGRTFQAIVTAVTATSISFNAPLDMDITTAAVVKVGNWNMNVNGSVTPVIYCVCPPPGVTWDITRIIGSINDDVEMDATTFGGIASLDNGMVLRVVDGYTKNIFVVNNNGGFTERAYDTEYDDRRSPQSEYGFSYRRTFAGQEKNGVVIRLNGDTGDKLEIIIQDDLTALAKLAHVVQGHVVD